MNHSLQANKSADPIVPSPNLPAPKPYVPEYLRILLSVGVPCVASAAVIAAIFASDFIIEWHEVLKTIGLPIAAMVTGGFVLLAARINAAEQNKLRVVQEQQLEHNRLLMETQGAQFREKLEADAIEADRRRLSEEYVDILDRFGDADHLSMQASAALMLGASLARSASLEKVLSLPGKTILITCRQVHSLPRRCVLRGRPTACVWR